MPSNVFIADICNAFSPMYVHVECVLHKHNINAIMTDGCSTNCVRLNWWCLKANIWPTEKCLQWTYHNIYNFSSIPLIHLDLIGGLSTYTWKWFKEDHFIKITPGKLNKRASKMREKQNVGLTNYNNFMTCRRFYAETITYPLQC